jgi:hypothetical protein
MIDFIDKVFGLKEDSAFGLTKMLSMDVVMKGEMMSASRPQETLKKAPKQIVHGIVCGIAHRNAHRNGHV